MKKEIRFVFALLAGGIVIGYFSPNIFLAFLGGCSWGLLCYSLSENRDES